MGLFNQIASALGGNDTIQRFMSGKADFSSPHSNDQAILGQMIQNASQDDLDTTFAETAKQTDDGEYRDHIKPASGAASPLANLSQSSLSMLAGPLISALLARGGLSIGQITQMIPGLHTTDPNRMNAAEVSSLADWTRRHHPDAFGHAAAEIGKQDPGLLQQLLGNRAMMTAAAKLAARFLS